MTAATGIGSWPGTDAGLAQRVVRDTLADGPEGLPYLPELPARGPGSDLVGRAAALLSGLSVDLQPSGWRLVDHAGRDEERAVATMRRDLDDLAETFDGYTGPFKLAVSGPWTLAAELRLARGERVVGDLGASRDVAQSLAEGLRGHVADVRRLLPGARVVVQLDEPSLPAVLAGRLPTSSGYGAHRAVDPEEVQRRLAEVVAAAREASAGSGARAGAAADAATEAGNAAADVVVHCCAAQVPVGLLRSAGAQALSLDTTLLDARAWEDVAGAVEAGVELWPGLAVPADRRGSVAALTAGLERSWSEVGLERERLLGVTLSPTCGLAGASPTQARETQVAVREAARSLAERIRS